MIAKVMGYGWAALWVVLGVVIYIGIAGAIINHWFLGRAPGYWVGGVIAVVVPVVWVIYKSITMRGKRGGTRQP
jgi:hypothetical protein